MVGWVKVACPAACAATVAIFTPGRSVTLMCRRVGVMFFSYGNVTSRNSMPWTKGRGTGCAQTGCRCQGDPPELHGPYLTWTRAVAGKTVTRKITADQQRRYQDWFDNARRLHQLVTELQTLSLKAFEQAEDPPQRP